MTSKTLKILLNEHKNILEIIEFLEKECDKIESGKSIDKNFFKKIVEFIRNYADKFHHAKEENILFSEMNKNQKELHCNPMAQMVYEHDLGRNYVKEIEKGIKEYNKNKVVENARSYCKLLREHIHKEYNILYPMADEILDKKAQFSMLEKFKKIEREKKEDKKKYLKFILELKRKK